MKKTTFGERLFVSFCVFVCRIVVGWACFFDLKDWRARVLTKKQLNIVKIVTYCSLVYVFVLEHQWSEVMSMNALPAKEGWLQGSCCSKKPLSHNLLQPSPFTKLRNPCRRPTMSSQKLLATCGNAASETPLLILQKHGDLNPFWDLSVYNPATKCGLHAPALVGKE